MERSDVRLLQPLEELIQVRDREAQLQEVVALRILAGDVPGGLDCEVHRAQLASVVRRPAIVRLLVQRQTKDVPIKTSRLKSAPGKKQGYGEALHPSSS